MKRVIYILFLSAVISGLSGCALIDTALMENPTSDDWANATCEDARNAYELSCSELINPFIDSEARIYWEAYKFGAGFFLARYCPDTITLPAKVTQ